jgi:hypothetical protein
MVSLRATLSHRMARDIGMDNIDAQTINRMRLGAWLGGVCLTPALAILGIVFAVMGQQWGLWVAAVQLILFGMSVAGLRRFLRRRGAVGKKGPDAS